MAVLKQLIRPLQKCICSGDDWLAAYRTPYVLTEMAQRIFGRLPPRREHVALAMADYDTMTKTACRFQYHKTYAGAACCQTGAKYWRRQLGEMHEWQPRPVTLSVKHLPFARRWRPGVPPEQMTLVLTTHVMSKNNEQPDPSPKPKAESYQQDHNGRRMRFDFGPLLLFFATNYIYSDLMLSVKILVAATLVSLVLSWHFDRKVSVMAAIGCAALVFFAGLTLYFDNELFIKIKPTVVTLFAALIAGGRLLGRTCWRPLLANRLT